MNKQIIGYCISRNYAINSTGELPDGNILDYLLKHQVNDAINCFYHLAYCAANVLYRLNLNKEQLNTLLVSGELFLEPDYTIYYLSDKYFAVKKGNYWNAPYAQFCDIGQYINWKLEIEGSLDYVAERAEIARAIGQVVHDTLHDKVGIHDIKNLTSPVRVFEQGYLNKIDLPTVDDIPEEAGKYAYAAAHEGWFDVYCKGHFLKAYDYDIVAAYPYWLKQLMELRYGKWIQATDYQPEAVYGNMFGEVTIDTSFSPVIYNSRKNTKSMNFTPCGTWECCISKQMYDFIYKYNIGTFQIYDACWWKPDHIVYPLAPTVDRLFKLREQSKGLSRNVIKRIMVGIWGKLLERKGDGFGEHFNPVWGEYVETMTKLQVAEACIQNGIVPLSVTIDGILTDKPLNVKLGNNMGDWKLSRQGKALVIGTEIVAVEGKERPSDFSLEYSDIMDKIARDPYAEQYSMYKLSPVTLNKAFKSSDIDKLGMVELTERTIEIGVDIKRCYPIAPKCGLDLLEHTYQGEPWDISFLKGLE